MICPIRFQENLGEFFPSQRRNLLGGRSVVPLPGSPEIAGGKGLIDDDERGVPGEDR